MVEIYRVIAVDPASLMIKSTSAPSYCLPSTVIYLSKDGLDDPFCDAILIAEIDENEPNIGEGGMLLYDIEFEYDGGEYVGVLKIPTSSNVKFYKFGEPAVGVISNISSL